MSYSELHCHSSFSLLDGASNPEELVLRAKEVGLSALALTDHNDLGGIVRFAQAAREVSLDAIIGAELSLEDESHLTLLAADVNGYKNLCHLISKARSTCPRGTPRVSYEDLTSKSQGLVALSGCPLGLIPHNIARGRPGNARQAAQRMLDIFAGNFFLELWDHHLSQEAVIAREMLELAQAYAIPWVVTNNVHYATPDKRIIHDVLTCIRHKVTLSTAGRRLRPNASWYLKSPEEMAYLWRHNPQGLKTTALVAERCQFRLGLLKPTLPVFPIPDECKQACPGTTHNDLLRQLVWEGAKKRYPDLTEKHIRQIEHELEMITRLDLAPYFLIMWDIVRFAKSQGIAVQGRGSAANSAVCYCLAITAVDPIGMDLLFERFLSEGRDEPPDIDLDIAHQEREKVLQYVYEKYGREHAAMVCEVITYRGPSAVRDAARVLGFSQEQADRLSAESHFHEALEAAQALAQGGAARAGLDVKDRRVQLLLKVVSGLDGLPRHRSIHVGGFVLSGEPLGDMVPIEPAAMAGRTVIQWDKDDLDPVGMIKVDLLGLGMLTVIQEAVKLVKQHRGIDIDLACLDTNDPAIYEMLCKADTIGIFQVESRAQMSILPKLRPANFYDIVVSIALVRPGPIQGNIVHPYVRRRRGEEPVTYLHPTLEPILKRTLGVPLFQEQGMRLAVVAAGFTPAQADHLRRVMSHKRSQERMARLCQDLAEGMRKNSFAEEAIATITHQLQAFANYGFPESHAASFALLVYASAYLKKYFAPEFYCAMLNAQPMGFYSPATLVRDAIRHGVTVHPVDLARSRWDCTLEPAANGAAVGAGHADRKSARPRTGEEPSGSERQLRAQAQEASHSEPPEHMRMRSRRQSASEQPARALSTPEPAARFRRCPRTGSADGALNSIACAPPAPPALRIGLRYAKGLGRKSKEALENAWRANGHFTSIEDVCLRSGLNWKSLQVLARAGALDSFCAGRREALWKVLALARQTGEPPLLKELPPSASPGIANIPAMTDLEKTAEDYRTMGLTTGKHPMTYYRDWAEKAGILACAQLQERADGAQVTVAGGVICRQRPETAKGFVFLTLEDETGMANVIVRPALFDGLRQVLLNHDFLVITGQLQIQQGASNIIARYAEPLPHITGDLLSPSRDFH